MLNSSIPKPSISPNPTSPTLKPRSLNLCPLLPKPDTFDQVLRGELKNSLVMDKAELAHPGPASARGLGRGTKGLEKEGLRM